MMPRRIASLLPLVVSILAITPTWAADPEPKELIEKALTAAGGQDKLLKLFEMRERLVIGAKVPPPVDPGEKGGRVSVVEPPANWWVNKKDRGGEPAKFLVHAWTLGILIDPKSKFEMLPPANIDGKAVAGLRVSGSVTPPLEMYFDGKEHRLVAIDWRNDRHLFSEWKKTEDGLWYAARAVGIKFTNAKTKTLAKNQWYQTDILELTRLKELPKGLER